MRIMPRLGGRLPGTVVAMLGMPPGERIVAWGAAETGDVTQTHVTVATDAALYVQATGDRLPWDAIVKASWEEPVLDLVVADEPGRAPRVLSITLDDSRDLPAAVHDRVTASVVISERVDLGDGAGALMVARRAGDDAPVRWTVVFDSGLDPTDPALREAADEALARLRSALGI